MSRTRARSADKNAAGALMLLRLAELTGDAERMQLARAILAECGYPGGEGAPSVRDAMAAVDAADAAR